MRLIRSLGGPEPRHASRCSKLDKQRPLTVPGDVALVSRWQQRVQRLIGRQDNEQVDDLDVHRCGTVRN